MARDVRKFTFDTFLDFGRQPETDEKAEADTPAVYSDSDLAAARADAFEEGRAKALLDHEGTDTHRVTNAIEKLADGLAAMGAAETARAHEFRTTALNVAVVALRKLLPELSRRFGQDEIEAVIAEALAEQPDEPRLVIRVPDAAFDPIAQRVTQLATSRGYAGKAVVLADAALGPADCRIEWADGGIERVAERTIQEISGAVARLCQTPVQIPPNSAPPTAQPTGV